MGKKSRDMLLGISCILTAVILEKKKGRWDPQVGDKRRACRKKNKIKIKEKQKKEGAQGMCRRKGEAI